MKKKIALTLCFLIAVIAGFSLSEMQSNTTSRALASAPENYDELSGCDKQDVLWHKIETSVHKDLPPYSKFGLVQLIKMSFQELQIKGNLRSDFAPEGWRKYLHKRGAVAKVKLVPKDDKFTGVFQGADCGLLRLSLTYKVAGSRPVAPGLALKILRDGKYSANVSALVSLDGQGSDFNFFKNPMSNIVPASESFGAKLVHRVFSKVTNYPEELVLEDMGLIGADGQKSKSPVSPRQIFLVPTAAMKFLSTEHDVRDDFLSIMPNTVIYEIRAVPAPHEKFNYHEATPEKMETFLKESVHIADLTTTSVFLASEFGDEGIFFRHQIRP